MAIVLDGRAALIISECQRGVIEPGPGSFAELVEQVQARGIVDRIAGLAERFRAAGMPVVHATIAHRPDFADVSTNSLLGALARKHRRVVEGTEEAAIVTALTPRPEDLIVSRSSGMIPFQASALDGILRRLEVRTVVLAGVSTNVAVAGSAMAAVDRNYRVVIAEDCVAGSDPHVHEVIIQEQLRMIARIASADEIGRALQAGLTGGAGMSPKV